MERVPGMVCEIKEYADGCALLIYRDDRPDPQKVTPRRGMSKEQIIAILVRRCWTIISWTDLVFESRRPQLEEERRGLIEELTDLGKGDA